MQITKLLANAAETEQSEAALDALAGGFAPHSADLKAGVEAYRRKAKPTFEGR